MPRSESTIASARAVLVGVVDRRLDRRALFVGQRLDRLQKRPEPVVGVDAGGFQRIAVLGEHVGEVRPDRVTEDDRVRHPHHRRLQVNREEDASLLGVGDLRGQEVMSAVRRMTAASSTSPALTRVLSLRTVTLSSGSTCSIRTAPSSSTVTDRSVERKSPSLIVDTCERESEDHSPIECGCWRACSLTEAGARRSELPCRRTGLTALPLTLS